LGLCSRHWHMLSLLRWLIGWFMQATGLMSMEGLGGLHGW
jgi:hypothetical protein